MVKKGISTSTFTFENLIESGALYVDKTEYFYKLVSGVSNCFFCARPRRFGKSLAISTFENIFLGRKELFKGLYIAGTDYQWDAYPVVRIDMSRCDSTTPENLTASIHVTLLKIAENYGVELRGDGIVSVEFDSLITALREKTGKKVVVLVDECDNPLTNNLDDAENLEKVRKVLESFYQIVKVQEPNERFVFMTGVTKFSKVSIFSKLNNLTDISMTRDYACMFGYTQKELEENFAPHIDEYVKGEGVDRAEFVAKVKKWYNGFKFDYEAETVYNPVSVGQFFNNNCRFQNYWFATSTPTFITKLAKKQQLTREDIDEAKISDSSLNAFDIGEFAKGAVPKPVFLQLLFQTGYLTMDEKLDFGATFLYKLQFPNFEVQDSFENILFEVYSGMRYEIAVSYMANIVEAAYDGRTERLIELFRNFFSELPYTIQLPEEKYYQTVIFCILKMAGMEIEAETPTNKGRIDAVLHTPKSIYLFEFKIDQSAEAAVEQILRKEYFQSFIEKARTDGKLIRCVGMNFSTAERNITGWLVG